MTQYLSYCEHLIPLVKQRDIVHMIPSLCYKEMGYEAADSENRFCSQEGRAQICLMKDLRKALKESMEEKEQLSRETENWKCEILIFSYTYKETSSLIETVPDIKCGTTLEIFCD